MIGFWGKAKDFVVKYWKLLAASIYALFVWFHFKNQADNAKEVVKVKEDSYKKQIDAIEETHKKEIELRDDALAEYQAIVEAVRAEYKEQNKRLSQKKKQEIQKLVAENAEDPSNLSKLIAEKFGITYTGSGKA